jgi:hypothetical protein
LPSLALFRLGFAHPAHPATGAKISRCPPTLSICGISIAPGSARSLGE